MTTRRDRARGCLLGLACGDALGRPVEFKSSAEIAGRYGRVTDMYGNGTHGQPAGTVTDDTEMALCIARSLVERGGFDGADVAARFVEWYESDPFDVGLMTAAALRSIREGAPWTDAGRAVWERRSEGSDAGNGSLMRCAPYGLPEATPADRAAVAAASSAITHADPRCVEACVAFSRIVAELLDGETMEDAVGTALSQAADRDAPSEVRTALASVGDTATVSLESTGYVIHTLETGLHEAMTARTAEEAVVSAVSRGGDADTVGAVTGAVAGARFGADALPTRWLNELDGVDELRDLADGLVDVTLTQ